MHRRQKLRRCKHFWEELWLCNANKVVPINPLGPIVHGLRFSSGNVFSIRCINTTEIPNHFTSIVFWCERRDLLCSHSNGDIFTCEDNMLFSHVKISSFRAKAHLVFHWCLYNILWFITACDLFLCFATFFLLSGILLTSLFFSLIHLFYVTREFYRFLHQDEPNLFHLSSFSLRGHMASDRGWTQIRQKI